MITQETVESMEGRDDLVAFIRTLRCSLTDNPSSWENADLMTYLDALAAWIEDMDGYFRNRGEAVPERPSWQLLAQMLSAARVYE
ncbi:MAG: DUF7660 family protein [Dehalococcoidia bacterium]